MVVCKKIDVQFIVPGHWEMPLKCMCGRLFSVHVGRLVFLSEVGKVKKFKSNGDEVLTLRNMFENEEKIFEGDWEAFVDPKSELRIARIKDNIERLYKRLQISESKRLIASHDKQTGAIMAFTNNLNSSLATFGGLMSLMANADKERLVEQESMGLNEQLNRNENILNYYYDLVEEFTGIEKMAAKYSRMKTRTGYSIVQELPHVYSKDDMEKCVRMIESIKRYARKQIQNKMMCSVACFGGLALSAVLVAILLGEKMDCPFLLWFVASSLMAIWFWSLIWFFSSEMEKMTDDAL